MADDLRMAPVPPPSLAMKPEELMTWLDILNRNAEALLRDAAPQDVRPMSIVVTHLTAAQATLHRVIAKG